jgi:hypothetical protein
LLAAAWMAVASPQCKRNPGLSNTNRGCPKQCWQAFFRIEPPGPGPKRGPKELAGQELLKKIKEVGEASAALPASADFRVGSRLVASYSIEKFNRQIVTLITMRGALLFCHIGLCFASCAARCKTQQIVMPQRLP